MAAAPLSSSAAAPAAAPAARPGLGRDAAPGGPSPWALMLPLGLALALVSPWLTLALAIAVGGAAILLARPEWALYCLAVTVPYQSLLHVKVNDVKVSVTEGVVALLLAAWMGRLVLGRAAKPAGTPLLAAIAALLTVFALTVFVAEDLVLVAKEVLKWIEMAAVYLAGTSLLRTARQRRLLLVWLVGAAVSQALIGLVQSALRIGPGHFMIGGVLMRAYGTFEQPNPFAGYLGLILPLAVALTVFGLRAGRWRRVAGAATALIAAALVITLSRGAWMGQAVALLLVATASSRTARHAVGTFGALAIPLLVALWPLLPAELSGRVASVAASILDVGAVRDATVTPENWATMERLSQWYAGWQMFRENPMLGVGIGNYNAAYEAYRLPQWPVALGHAHNHYLTVAAEAGFVGFVTYVGFLAVAFGSGAQARARARDRLGRAAAVGILGSLAAYATHNLFDVLFVHGMGALLGLLLTLLHGIPRGLEDAMPSPGGAAQQPRQPPGGRRRGNAAASPPVAGSEHERRADDQS